jgi:hypothetical protein
MADARLIRVYYEGDDDRNVLEGLSDCGLLPHGQIAQRDKKYPGQDGLIHELAAFVRPVNGVAGRAIALIDLDDRSREQLASWFHTRLEVEAPGVTVTPQPFAGRVRLFNLTGDGRSGHVVLVPVGLAEDAALREEYGIERFAMDDHLLYLIRRQDIYVTVAELESVPHDIAMKKLQEIAQVLRANGLPVRHSKRFLHILRAVAAVHPSSAAFVGRLMKKARDAVGPDGVRNLFRPLAEDLHSALAILQPAEVGSIPPAAGSKDGVTPAS